ncbi:MAG: arginine--tRNA ligase [Acidobacteria bacterium]|jgi:arginyl-tRNA synthetase|nr:arginine--tRNA ligase [Acidobacteriota bacterium]MDP7339014.1 arginine--tRNA ligase [Vicinamibacterales bacterium]HJN43627.1 arginine--tRNA ligase [Vicinamibacterales bacterium]
MILPLHAHLRDRITTALAERYGLDTEAMPAIVIEYAPNRRLGDLAVTVAFELARTLRKAPRAIAQEIAESVGEMDGLGHLEPTGAGYLNLFLDRAAFACARVAGNVSPDESATTVKTIVEHTAINPNKAAHVGHLRNAALGDTLCRLLTYRGADVEVQNYIDDTGVQVADVVVGLRELEHKGIDEIRALAEAPRFDYYCWDLYARVTRWYDEDEARLSHRQAVLQDLEHGVDPAAGIADVLTDRIVRCHLDTMARFGVEYDLLSWEGDILRLQFWDRAFDILKASGTVFLQADGRLAGCWVMPIDDGAQGNQPDAETMVATGDGDEDTEARLKVIVRSNGTVTYVGKDIAYQLWKFGLLGRDFHYRWFATQSSGRPLWATTSAAGPPAPDRGPVPPFGRAGAVYNVIDTRQSYLQELLVQALMAMEHPREAERSVHFSYEMVALSRDTAQALGYIDAASDDDKPFVEVSGRKGLGVKADDLLDQLTERAKREVTARHADLAPEEQRRTATIIATAAIRYFMIKFSRTKVIAFDIDEALSFEGETGPYLQYAAVRARKILHKLEAREGIAAATWLPALASTPTDGLVGEAGDELWDLILEASRLDEVAEQAVRTLELSVLAKFAFGLAQRFNGFYHSSPVIAEHDDALRHWRAAGVTYFLSQMTRALELMGCAVPERM